MTTDIAGAPLPRGSPWGVPRSLGVMGAPSRVTQTLVFPTVHRPVVDTADHVPHEISCDESVDESDETAHEADAIADEELTQQGQMRADLRAPLEHEPVGGDEDAQARHHARNDALD